MSFIKCIPILGTALSACECINAAVHGDFEGAAWKLGETVLDGALDALTIASGGLTGIITAPGKAAAKEAGKVAGKVVGAAVCARVLGGAVADTITSEKQSPYYETIYRSRDDSDYCHETTNGTRSNTTGSRTTVSNTNGNSTGAAGGGGQRDHNGGRRQGEHERQEGLCVLIR
ncbi:unnamed protein product [Rotaria sp. Silwood2]|nr:unnamed protein product [Rotaria sp. Silwood2]CAF4446266.1 unnamed protein product [Rotaria sp. Silwood2]